jgi:predicted nucleic acid-binding protein
LKSADDDLVWGSSALIKRYVREQGSEWLRAEIAKNEVVISQVTTVEVAAALGRKFRQGAISKFAFYQSRRMFLLHLKAGRYKIFGINQRIIDESLRLTFRRGLRAYDALQLATALVIRSEFDQDRFIFLTADAVLEAVGRAEGLNTDNPLSH